MSPPGAGREDDAERLRRVYDERADAYQEIWAPILEPFGRHLLDELRRDCGDRVVADVLDLGTGVGTLLPHLEDAFPGASLLGVDQSPGMLRFVPRRFRCAVMDASKLDLPDGSTDVVTAVFMLFHLPTPLSGAREVRRVLRPGGRLGTLTWGPGRCTCDADVEWVASLDAHHAPSSPPVPPSSYDELDTPAKMEGILAAAGFDRVRAWRDELEAALTPADFLSFRMAMGRESARFLALSPDGQRECVADMRRRLTRLPSEAFVIRGEIIYAIAAVRS